MRKISSKNIKTAQPFKFFEWLLAFGILLSITSFSFENTDFESKNQQDSYRLKVSQENTPDTFIQNSGPTRQADVLLEFELVEESETTDDSTEDDIVEGDCPVVIPTRFGFITLESSFQILALSLQKRTLIPLFLLHHSWKIPLA